MQHELPETASEWVEFRGWIFYVDDSNSEDDCMKIEYYAVKDDVVHRLDHSPYDNLTIEGIVSYHQLGFPPRKGNAAWTNASIIAAAQDNLNDPN